MSVWRKTKPCDIGRVGPRHPWEFDCPTESVVYLEFPFALGEGRHFELRFPDCSLPPAALTVFGPIGFEQGKDEWGQKLVNPHLFPAFEKWPTLEAYWDIFWYPPMSEFTVQSPMAETAYVWGYLAAAPRTPHKASVPKR